MRRLALFYKSLFIARRFFFLVIGVVVFYVIAFYFRILMLPVFIWSMFVVAATVADIILLYSKRKALQGERLLPERLSNGDENAVNINVTSLYTFVVDVKIVDELPVQFQKRDFRIEGNLQPNQLKKFTYVLKPVRRGEYHFGNVHFFVTTLLKLVERKVTLIADKVVACYPSYIQMRKYQLLAATNKLNEIGVKQVRRIGHSLEFEQIKEYVPGDDYRTVNWKASSRRNNTLMVNNYTDERSQPVYCMINAGRVMKMPFNDMTLLDYAINASLVLSSVALTKHDKAGLIAYGDKWLKLLPAERTSLQMNNILYRLYNLETNFLESDIEKLYFNVKTKVPHRSLLIYFTNYETFNSLRRELPYLRMLNKNHLLLVIFFENSELKSLISSSTETVEEVYTKTIAEKFAFEKRLIAKELQQYGILSILSSPAELTVNTINKYIELKARQAI
jgi:uncharacterized protein (DUF58 family)